MDTIKITVDKIPLSVHKKLMELAKKDDRSLSSYIRELFKAITQ